MSAQDVLTYCREMLSKPSSIEHMQSRNIVSRAYYFTYYECINHVEKRLGWDETTTKGGVHTRALSRLLDKTYADIQKQEDAALIYTRINNLKKLRVRADYKLDSNISRTTAEYCVAEAEKISFDLASL